LLPAQILLGKNCGGKEGKMKYKVVLPEIALIVHVPVRVNSKNFKKVAKMAIAQAEMEIGFLTRSKRQPEYLGRGNWRVPLKDIVLGIIEASSPEEAIDKMCEKLGIFEENFEAIPLEGDK
jgi:ABC-type sulfate transport system substrate-binding protein